MWSQKYDCCLRCGGVDTPHYGFGYCNKCIWKSKEYKIRRNIRRMEYRRKHPEKAKVEWDKYNKRIKPRKITNEAINQIVRGRGTTNNNIKIQIKAMQEEINSYSLI